MRSSATITDALVREAIHARLWMQVMRSGRHHRFDPAGKSWRPDLSLYAGERYQSPGKLDPDDDYPEEFANAKALEDWLQDLGLVEVPDEPNDMSIFEATIRGPLPTLRESLSELTFPVGWVRNTALRYCLWEGAHFYPSFGIVKEHRLERLPQGWGEHPVLYHFAPLIDALTEAGFCDRVGESHFVWTEAIRPHGAATHMQIWEGGPNPWEQRKWELLHIWRCMPPSIKAKYLVDKGPLNLVALDMDLSTRFDKASRLWHVGPIGKNAPVLSMGHVCDEFDRLDREDGLPGRKMYPDRMR